MCSKAFAQPLRFCLSLAFVIAAISLNLASAQTNPAPRAIPFTENFGTASFSSYPSGFGGWNGLSGATITSQSLAEASSPTGDATIVSRTSTTTTAGISGYASNSNGRLYVQTSSNTTNGVNQAILAINATDYQDIVVSYDVEILLAEARTIGVVCQFRVGISGAWTTITPDSGSNPYSQAGGTTGVKTTVIATLPTSVNNQPVVQVRWAIWRGSETGNSSGLAIDNVEVSGTLSNNETPPSIVSLSPVNGAVGVPVDVALTITFDKAVKAGNGNVVLYRDQVVVESFAASSGNFNGASVSFTPSADLDFSESYHVIIEATAFEDLADNSFPGLLANTDWAFTTVGSDETGPVPVTRIPSHGATKVSTKLQALRVTFDEPITLVGENDIEVRTVAGDTVVASIPADDEDSVSLGGPTELVVSLPSGILAPATGYYVSIPAGTVEDALGNPNLAFGAPASDVPWTFTTATRPVVVINKYLNGGGASLDLIELLVIGNEVPGSTVDMRGMIVKDFSSSMGGDGGAKFEFADTALWQAVPVGTLIVLRFTPTSLDTDPGNFTLDVGLGDTSLFSGLGGSFDIATNEMVMIKAAGSGADGVDGGIHALAAGAAGSFFTSFNGPKLIATGTTGTGFGVIADNSNSIFEDFDGTGATGNLAAANMSFGVPNNLANASYISQLRGLTLGDGMGVATMANATPASPFGGSRIFGRGLSDQSVSITVSMNYADVTLTDVVITVPADFGIPLADSITLTGPGSTDADVVVEGQQIRISGAAITTANHLVASIADLETPASFEPGDYGRRSFTVSTAAAGGTATGIGTSPSALVTLPIANLRATDANGVPLALGVEVAVEGVVTMASFNTANTQASIQDGSAGISLFNSDTPSPFTRGNRYMVFGPVSQFNGLTQITYAGGPNIIDLGVGVEPVPLVLTIPDLLADAEGYESSVVTIENLTFVSGTWGASQTVVLRDASENTLNVRITAGSAATTEPGYPVTITGVLGQSDNSSPFTSGYQIMPRNAADLVTDDVPPPTEDDFAAWISGFNVGGQTGPRDTPAGDGVPNILKHVFGLAPDVAVTGSLVRPTAASANSITFGHTRIKLANLASDVVAGYEWSVDLVDWAADGETSGGVKVDFAEAVIVDDSDEVFDVVSVTASVSEGTAARLFVRVKADVAVADD
ncbi:MAG: Ig-like domain-containing protein [Luteolibacter sp.]